MFHIFVWRYLMQVSIEEKCRVQLMNNWRFIQLSQNGKR